MLNSSRTGALAYITYAKIETMAPTTHWNPPMILERYFRDDAVCPHQRATTTAAKVSNNPANMTSKAKVTKYFLSSIKPTFKNPDEAKIAIPSSTTPTKIIKPPATDTNFCNPRHFLMEDLFNLQLASIKSYSVRKLFKNFDKNAYRPLDPLTKS